MALRSVALTRTFAHDAQELLAGVQRRLEMKRIDDPREEGTVDAAPIYPHRCGDQ